MKVFSGTCIVTRGDHQAVHSLIGAYETREAAISALLLPAVNRAEDAPYPKSQISDVQVRELDPEFLRNMAEAWGKPKTRGMFDAP